MTAEYQSNVEEILLGQFWTYGLWVETAGFAHTLDVMQKYFDRPSNRRINDISEVGKPKKSRFLGMKQMEVNLGHIKCEMPLIMDVEM